MFFASKPKKVTGALRRIQMDHFDNPPAQRAFWNVIKSLVDTRGSQSAETPR